MLPIFRKRHPPVGARPGTLMVPETPQAPRIRLIRVEPERIEESEVTDVASLGGLRTATGLAWVDVEGLGDEAMLRQLGDLFAIHPLALEDLVNAPQRPKAEAYQDQILLITRVARFGGDGEIHIEQVGLVVGPGYVLSFQEDCADILDPIRQRLRDGKGPIRSAGPSYLAYAILDTIIDNYYPVIERISEQLERLEIRIIHRPTPRTLETLNRIKTRTVLLRRGLWPQREALTQLIKEPNQLVTDQVRIYMRDTFDHCAQMVDVVDSQRELVNGLMNTYLSVIGNRTNEVMKVLTIMTSIFIPLTLVVGIYGMNFDYMPELHSRWSYPVVLLIMVAVAGGMLIYFRRNGWLGGQDQEPDEDDEPDEERGRSKRH
jgi:magnesium transporter